MIEKIRLSIGTAIQLGLETGNLDPYFTTAFAMTYKDDKCESNCAFCPQARDSFSSSDRLARISWPEYDFQLVIDNWQSRKFRRICLQTICYTNVVDDVVDIVSELRKVSKLPISVAIHSIEKGDLIRLRNVGVSNVGIALDACTPVLFEQIKGEQRDSKYRWNRHIQALEDALKIFGKGNVTTHLIIGLGETEKEATDFIVQMHEMGIGIGLFAFTAIKGTSLEGKPSPDLSSYRRIQVIRHLVSKGLLYSEQISSDKEGRVSLDLMKAPILKELSSGEAFQVTGCKGCNRPYYNERPRGPMYNYPKPLSKIEVIDAIKETQLV
ncbi:MAG: radical SAM protein [Candidatus Odinarchaeota archaeon]